MRGQAPDPRVEANVKRRFAGRTLLLAGAGVVAALVLGELVVWAARPTEYLYPRYQFSPEYGLIPFADVVMVHGVPRKFEYRYTINAYQCRGETPAPGPQALPATLILGDSNAFGMGVSDGEEFPAVMRRTLAGRVEVVNLSSPGWGLTQQIRRYYEFGVRYDPKVIVLQYCSNDPDDNLANRVTVIENNDFVFLESANSFNWVKKHLSRSFVQRTQLYNFVRATASRALLPRQVEREAARLDNATAPAASDASTAQERVYIELLDLFARRVHSEGRRLIVISVDRQLAPTPHIERAVMDLEARGLLDYVEVMDWLEGRPRYDSPEGHVWGTAAHAIIGEHLSEVVANTPANPPADFTSDAP